SREQRLTDFSREADRGRRRGRAGPAAGRGGIVLARAGRRAEGVCPRPGRAAPAGGRRAAPPGVGLSPPPGPPAPPRPGRGPPPAAGNWLILADRGGLGEALARLLERQGGKGVLVPCGEVVRGGPDGGWQLGAPCLANLESLCRSLGQPGSAPFRGVVHLWGL